MPLPLERQWLVKCGRSFKKQLDPTAPRTTLEIQKSLHEEKNDSDLEDTDGIEEDDKKPENGNVVDADDFFAVSKPAAHPSGWFHFSFCFPGRGKEKESSYGKFCVFPLQIITR